ncbi:MAG: hypothetical protein ABIS92_08000, partial [Polyangia bacterium]
MGGAAFRPVVLFLLVTPAASCNGAAEPQTGASPNSARAQNVLVVDESIDTRAEVFRNKVIAAYTLDCQTATRPRVGAAIRPAALGGSDFSATFDELKARYIQLLTTDYQDCRLSAGIDAKPDPLAAVARFKSRWNEMLRSQQPSSDVFSPGELLELEPAIDAETQALSSHGTATAG